MVAVPTRKFGLHACDQGRVNPHADRVRSSLQGTDVPRRKKDMTGITELGAGHAHEWLSLATQRALRQ